jgi:hypothetical protein
VVVGPIDYAVSALFGVAGFFGALGARRLHSFYRRRRAARRDALGLTGYDPDYVELGDGDWDAETSGRFALERPLLLGSYAGLLTFGVRAGIDALPLMHITAAALMIVTALPELRAHWLNRPDGQRRPVANPRDPEFRARQRRWARELLVLLVAFAGALLLIALHARHVLPNAQ